MSDNIPITPGSGKTIAADDIASVYYQRVKIAVGADGEATDLDFGQAVMANSLPVAIASDQAAVAVDAACLIPNGTQADQRLTVDNTTGGVQFAAFHADTTHIFWTSETADVRVTFDGSTPTAANGHVIPAGSSGVWRRELAQAARFIRNGAVSAVIHASQLKLR